LGKKAVGLDCAKAVLRFEDGEEAKSDLVIVADGVHVSSYTCSFVIFVTATDLELQSDLANFVAGYPVEVIPLGRSIFRFLLPMEKVLSDPQLSELYKDGKAGFRISLDFANDILFVNYGCRSNTLLNCGIVHNTCKGQDESDLWNSKATIEEVLETCQQFHPTMKRYVELCKDLDISVHHSMRRPALPTFINGRTLILGDAAHAMLPTHSAGLTVGVESAAALEPIMSGVMAGDFEGIKKRLAIWDKLRVPRCNVVMLLSNAGPEGLNVSGVEEEIRQYYDGELPPKEAGLWTEKSRKLFFDCDAVKEAMEAMERESHDGS